MSKILNPIANDYSAYKKFGLKPNKGIDFGKFSIKKRRQILTLILFDILEGKRRHKQSEYHCVVPLDADSFDSEQEAKITIEDTCGTAHCIAGWMAVEQSIASKLDIFGNQIEEAAEEVIEELFNGKEYVSVAFFEDDTLLTSFKDNASQNGYEHYAKRLLDFNAETWAWAGAVLRLDNHESREIFSEYLEDIEKIILNYFDMLEEKVSNDYACEILGVRNREELKNKVCAF